ncbi:MAG: hypothetical protein OEU46_05450 [Alphaproteobacteria bacterium]|nr:hypothetical protein [Alphaproteobacteria bacterium]
MHQLEFLDPRGATEITQLHATRLAALDGRKIGLLSNDMWQAHRALPLVGDWLTAHFPEATVIPETAFPRGNNLIDSDATADALAAQAVDAVVIGNAA